MSAIVRRLVSAVCALVVGVFLAQASFAMGSISRVQRGMPEAQVREILGPPTSTNTYPTGKGWIPFYGWWGGDSWRTEYRYKGQGRVVFNQKPFSSTLKVINVIENPSEKGY